MLQTERFTTQLSTSGRLIKFTPERLQQIRNLIERGKSREEIAELIGVTVGTLQVTCSRLGISLRRPVFDAQAGLLRRGGTNNGPTPSRDGGVPIPPTKEQPQKNSQSGPVEQAQATTAAQEKSHKGDLANLALRMQYRGHERITELPLTQDMIRRLAFEAQFRDMSMGKLVSELIMAMINEDLFQRVLEQSSNQT
jgi:predicted transcriptional regulator